MKHYLQLFIYTLVITFTGFVYGQTTITTYDTITKQGQEDLSPLVSAMKMNVLYLGLDNPVQISVPGKYDEVVIECAGGKISGAGGGGFMIFYCPVNTKYAVQKSLEQFGGRYRRYKITEHGLTTWTI